MDLNCGSSDPQRNHASMILTNRELTITEELAILFHKWVVLAHPIIPNFLCVPYFNECIQFIHLKMENLQDVFDLVNPGVWMASIGLRDAYYTIPVAPDHQKYLTFSWQDVYYSYTCLPNGYSQARYIFTKILKVPFGYLRKHCYSSVV